MSPHSEAVGDDFDVSVVDAAASMLKDRLKRVRRRFAAAVKHGKKNAELIHQLRVATRRAAAVLDLFDDFVPQKRAKKLNRNLTRIRRAAGRVRDCDLILPRLATDGKSVEADSLHRGISARRRHGYQKLRALYAEVIDSGRLKRQTRSLVKRVRRASEQSEGTATRRFREWAPERLRAFVNDFFEASTVDLENFSKLHRFRIRSKSLRYAMEAVAAAFPPEFRQELSPSIEHLQTLLGEINDESNFLQSVRKRRSTTEGAAMADDLDRRMADERHVLEGLRHEFVQWWTDDRRDELKRRFDPYLPSQPDRDQNAG